MQKITPCLWFDRDAEDAMRFYASLFKDSEMKVIKYYPEGKQEGPLAGMEGQVLTGIFQIEGYQFMCLDGGPRFQFNPSISFFVNCSTKAEVDRIWGKLSEGGGALMPLGEYPFSPWYGWIQDRYGVTWQLILNAGEIYQTIIPSLMFVGERAGDAEAAIHFYSQLFGSSVIGDIMRYGPDQTPEEEGTVAYARFTLAGQEFAAMDSAQEHNFAFNEAISFYVECHTQDEVDAFWTGLSAVPDAEQCGWLKDRYGLSWQIVPKQLGDMLDDPDPEKSGRVMQAMLEMKKIDIASLEQAYWG